MSSAGEKALDILLTNAGSNSQLFQPVEWKNLCTTKSYYWTFQHQALLHSLIEEQAKHLWGKAAEASLNKHYPHIDFLVITEIPDLVTPALTEVVVTVIKKVILQLLMFVLSFFILKRLKEGKTRTASYCLRITSGSSTALEGTPQKPEKSVPNPVFFWGPTKVVEEPLVIPRQSGAVFLKPLRMEKTTIKS